MESNKIIHIKNAKGTPDEQYIGRAGHGQDGYFGNPIKIGSKCVRCGEIHKKAGDTLSCYEQYLQERIGKDEEFKNKLKNLNGKTLVCFCKKKKDSPCHGDIMAYYISKLNNEEDKKTEENQLSLF